MVTCCAIGCVNRSDRRYCRGVTFHKFPSEPVRRELWVKAVQRGEWQPAQRSVLCSAHFNEEDFDRTSLSSVRLRPGAVPTKFPDPNTKSRKSINRNISNQFDGFFSLSARLCELSASIQEEEIKTLKKEDENVHVETEVNTQQVVEDNVHQNVEENIPDIKPEVIPQIPNQVTGIKRKPDTVPDKLSEVNSEPLKKLPRTATTHITEGLMPHRFLEIQLNENEKHKNSEPDILSQIMSCNENLAVTVSTVPSRVDNSITTIKMPRTSQKNMFKNVAPVRESTAPLPHEFLEVELKVLEEQKPEIKLFLSDEISIRKVSRKNIIRPGLTIKPSVPPNMRDNSFSQLSIFKRLNQT